MRAARVNEYGTVENIRVEDIPTPAPGPGDVLVRVTVGGVNFADVGMSTGAARRTPPPFSPGVEAAGTVEALGEGVTGFAAGERVVYWNGMPSAFAEYAVVPAWRLVKVPAGVTDEVAVALMVQGTTAHYLATDSHALKAGETCLIWAAAGGVGHLLTQIAVAKGARVVAIVGGEEKTRFARRMGAAVAIDRRERDVAEAVKEATEGLGCDAVYDSVGAATIETSLLATKRRGTCVLYGGASGPVTTIDSSLMARAGSIFFTRPGLADHLRNAEEIKSRMADLFAWHLAGSLTPQFGGEYTLAEVPKALTEIASGQTTGKLLIRVR
jgi:NADPH2:quinone reductase